MNKQSIMYIIKSITTIITFNQQANLFMKISRFLFWRIMQIRINKEIRNCTESIFFGLSSRQFTFSCIACVIAGITYLKLNSILGMEITSWLCILIAMPFAALGFITFQGLTFEQIIVEAIASVILSGKRLISIPYNLYYDLTKEIITKRQKEDSKRDKELYKTLKAEQRQKKSS